MQDFIDSISLITQSLFTDFLPKLTNFWLNNPILLFILALICFNFIIELMRKVKNKTQL